MFNIKKNAFTLSEVLIALTIIGVVAAITVPRVMTGSKTKADVVRLKRAYIAIQDALRIASAKQGYNMSDITNFASSASHPYNAEDLLNGAFDARRLTSCSYDGNWGSAFLLDYDSNNNSEIVNGDSVVRGASERIKNVANADDLVYSGRNGAYYIIKVKKNAPNNFKYCSVNRPCILYIDINGKDKGPNEMISCTSDSDNIGTIPNNENGYYIEPDACTVDDAAVTDIYAFFIYDAEVRPATKATVAVMEK